MNIVVLIGRAVAPPELRYTPSGKAVANFTLAVDRARGQEKEADFISIQCWERTAEVATQYVTKGKQLSVQGSLRIRTYETQDGQKRKVAEVVCNHLEFLGGGKAEKSDNEGRASGFDADDLSVDEIPF